MRCGVSRRAVADWEAGRCYPRSTRFTGLAAAVETTEAYIEHGDLGVYRQRLRELTIQVDEELGGSKSDPDGARLNDSAEHADSDR